MSKFIIQICTISIIITLIGIVLSIYINYVHLSNITCVSLQTLPKYFVSIGTIINISLLILLLLGILVVVKYGFKKKSN